ncbi:MAG: ribosome silencing factor [Elusimicrobia bacterium]|nr:ribosome silencing factor [Elusimicrobiota bacterium]
MARTFKSIAVAAARAAWDKKGEAIEILDVSSASPLADYLLIVTALSPAHLEALQHEIEKAAHVLGLRLLRRSQPRSDQWRVLDFGGLLVHLMSAQTREFYALEKLYHGAARVRWHARTPSPKPAPPKLSHAKAR